MAHKQQQSSLSSYEESKMASPVPKAIRSGTVSVRERGTFTGTAWRSKRLELDDQCLTIINTSNSKRTRIALSSITELERTDLTDHSLSLKAKEKLRHFSFATDSELYDWQDDIYRRCPLGNYSEPFDFVHKSHIGSGHVAGTFTDPNILPIYAEIIGAQPSVARSSSGIVVAPRSRPVSGVPLAAITKGISSSGSGGNTILEGAYVVKQAGIFAGWMWKQRWLTLTPQALVIHSRKTKSSPADKSISLPTITSIEQDPKRENCLVLEHGGSPSSFAVETLCINFLTSTDLYTWRDALYLRSPLSLPIGNPTNFVHKIHVGFDSATGVFTGLPTEWASIMNPPGSAPATSGGDRKARRQSRRKSAPLVPPPT